jgi:hypothetical protein
LNLLIIDCQKPSWIVAIGSQIDPFAETNPDGSIFGALFAQKNGSALSLPDGTRVAVNGDSFEICCYQNCGPSETWFDRRIRRSFRPAPLGATLGLEIAMLGEMPHALECEADED